MRAFAYWLLCMVLIGILACSPKNEASDLPPEGATLTVEQWKALPVSVKFDGETMERLRESDDKLKSGRAWKQFMETVVQPEAKKSKPDSGW